MNIFATSKLKLGRRPLDSAYARHFLDAQTGGYTTTKTTLINTANTITSATSNINTATTNNTNTNNTQTITNTTNTTNAQNIYNTTPIPTTTQTSSPQPTPPPRDTQQTVSERPKSSSAIRFADEPSTMTLFPEYSWARVLIGECDKTTIDRCTSTPSFAVSSFAFASSVQPGKPQIQKVSAHKLCNYLSLQLLFAVKWHCR